MRRLPRKITVSEPDRPSRTPRRFAPYEEVAHSARFWSALCRFLADREILQSAATGPKAASWSDSRSWICFSSSNRHSELTSAGPSNYGESLNSFPFRLTTGHKLETVRRDDLVLHCCCRASWPYQALRQRARECRRGS